MLLQAVTLPASGDTFPFTLPLLRGSRELVFDSPVTIIVGENGSGKSTLLEALAWACGILAAGSVGSIDNDETLVHARYFRPSHEAFLDTAY